MFKIASWNVNSLSVRLPQVLAWINTHKPDVLALQETKLTDDKFPIEAFKDQGLNVEFSGQKTYNGVAIISPHAIDAPLKDLPNYHDVQRRILCATVKGIRIINLYVPNGQALDSDKYTYKLDWLSAVTQHLKEELHRFPNLCVLGDFNIAPQDSDVYDPIAFAGNVLVSENERKAFNQMLELGLVDTFRALHQEAIEYSWWDYRQAAFRRNMGLRIDHILLSQILWPHCKISEIDKLARAHERPSDHAPVMIALDKF